MNEDQRTKLLGERGLAEMLHMRVRDEYLFTFAYFERLIEHEKLAPDLEPYVKKPRPAAAT